MSKKIKILSNVVGQCPYCNSNDIDYKALQLEDDGMVFYPATCNSCKNYFEEWYSMSFAGHNVGSTGEFEADNVIGTEIEYQE